jgi:adenylate cyclase
VPKFLLMRRAIHTRTFVFADLAGFTALTEARGDAHAAEVVGRFRGLVRGLLDHCQARSARWVGDAVLLSVADAADGVRLALAIVERAAARADLPPVRVGVHTGTAVRRGGDWFGSGVNVAARTADRAAPGQVVLTEATLAAAGRLDLDLRALEQVPLKNLTTPCSAVRRRGAGLMPGTGGPRAARRGRITSVFPPTAGGYALGSDTGG